MESFIIQSGQNENNVREEINSLKGEFSSQFNNVNTKLTPLLNVQAVIEANRLKVNRTTDRLRSDLTTLDKRVCSWTTFEN